MWLVIKIFCMYLLTAILMTGVMGIDAFGGRSDRIFKFCLPYGGQDFGLAPHKSTRTHDHIVEVNIDRNLYQCLFEADLLKLPQLNYLNTLDN